VNFLAFEREDGPVMPFLELSKGMARGIGFGGEGDVLTAALVGALSRGFGATTFTEIFCADWSGESLFLSHMGEMNPDLAAGRAVLMEKDWGLSPAPNPAYLAGCLRAGPAVFVNLVPGPGATFDLLVAPVEMLGDSSRDDMRGVVRGWMRPRAPVADFLETYSRLGGTHHSALVMGERAAAIETFARYAGIPCHVI
jgi:L-arabinose isomerase